MAYHDPYTPERCYFECYQCGYRSTASKLPGGCPECDGNVHNIAVARE
ncbi:rubrerythrin-like domain-containing protein [Natronobiforma cellulositropha]|nr:rubrerythrin-like domain-containing protein [Natronobiforma cellulositropha]